MGSVHCHCDKNLTEQDLSLLNNEKAGENLIEGEEEGNMKAKSAMMPPANSTQNIADYKLNKENNSYNVADIQLDNTTISKKDNIEGELLTKLPPLQQKETPQIVVSRMQVEDEK